MQIGWEGVGEGGKYKGIIGVEGDEESSNLGKINERSQVRIISFQPDASCCGLEQQAEAG